MLDRTLLPEHDFGGPSWASWRTLIAVAFGDYHALSPPEQHLAQQCTHLADDECKSSPYPVAVI